MALVEQLPGESWPNDHFAGEAQRGPSSWYPASSHKWWSGCAETSEPLESREGEWWWAPEDPQANAKRSSGRHVSYYGSTRSSGQAPAVGKEQQAGAAGERQVLPRVWVSGGRQSSATSSTGAVLRKEHAFDAEVQPHGRNYAFMSEDLPEADAPSRLGELPGMSADGGSEEEFQEYWRRNKMPQRLRGGWIGRVSHPQVNVQPYWYHAGSRQTVWIHPGGAEEASHELCNDAKHMATSSGSPEARALQGSGLAWDLSVTELKAILSAGEASDYGLKTEELARRAVATYEAFEPRVLSWHDYQYLTFWFFGGMKKDRERSEASGSTRTSTAAHFFGEETDSRSLFAEEAFFQAAGNLIRTRLWMDRMHPINLTYFIWCFTRAQVVLPSMMRVVGDWLCDGRLPMLDRCSLGTMLWNFAKQKIRHDRFFEDGAAELCRPHRLRTLAPRNFQNSIIAFNWAKHWNAKLVDAMARGIIRLLDAHDTQFPKLDRALLFSYTCKDGSEVPADCFRISSCTVIAKAFHELSCSGRILQQCFASMLSYTQRSVATSPAMMREPGDASALVRQLAIIAQAELVDVTPMLRSLDIEPLCADAPGRSVEQMQAALRRCGAL